MRTLKCHELRTSPFGQILCRHHSMIWKVQLLECHACFIFAFALHAVSASIEQVEATPADLVHGGPGFPEEKESVCLLQRSSVRRSRGNMPGRMLEDELEREGFWKDLVHLEMQVNTLQNQAAEVMNEATYVPAGDTEIPVRDTSRSLLNNTLGPSQVDLEGPLGALQRGAEQINTIVSNSTALQDRIDHQLQDVSTEVRQATSKSLATENIVSSISSGLTSVATQILERGSTIEEGIKRMMSHLVGNLTTSFEQLFNRSLSQTGGFSEELTMDYSKVGGKINTPDASQVEVQLVRDLHKDHENLVSWIASSTAEAISGKTDLPQAQRLLNAADMHAPAPTAKMIGSQSKQSLLSTSRSYINKSKVITVELQHQESQFSSNFVQKDNSKANYRDNKGAHTHQSTRRSMKKAMHTSAKKNVKRINQGIHEKVLSRVTNAGSGGQQLDSGKIHSKTEAQSRNRELHSLPIEVIHDSSNKDQKRVVSTAESPLKISGPSMNATNTRNLVADEDGDIERMLEAAQKAAEEAAAAQIQASQIGDSDITQFAEELARRARLFAPPPPKSVTELVASRLDSNSPGNRQSSDGLQAN